MGNREFIIEYDATKGSAVFFSKDEMGRENPIPHEVELNKYKNEKSSFSLDAHKELLQIKPPAMLGRIE